MSKRASKEARARQYRKRRELEKEVSAAKRATGQRYGGSRIDERVVAARLAEIPEDTRSLTARMMGDPIPNDPRRPWRYA